MAKPVRIAVAGDPRASMRPKENLRLSMLMAASIPQRNFCNEPNLFRAVMSIFFGTETTDLRDAHSMDAGLVEPAYVFSAV
jgi:hypothetical protein